LQQVGDFFELNVKLRCQNVNDLTNVFSEIIYEPINVGLSVKI